MAWTTTRTSPTRFPTACTSGSATARSATASRSRSSADPAPTAAARPPAPPARARRAARTRSARDRTAPPCTPRRARRSAPPARGEARRAARAACDGAGACGAPTLDRGQLLHKRHHGGEEVAVLGHARAHRRGVAHLVPRQRRRDGRPLARAQGVHVDRRLVLVVLAPVDEHLAAAQRLGL